MNLSMHRAVFLDLNGTLVEPVHVKKPEQLTVIEGAFASLAALHRAGFLCPIVTVQSRIASGYFSGQEFEHWFRSFAARAHEQGAELLGPYICPHAFKEPCKCQKPYPFLYEQAAKTYDIDTTRSYVIGDTASDLEAGVNIGAVSCLVTTGWGHYESNREAAKTYRAFVGANLPEVVEWILSQKPLM